MESSSTPARAMLPIDVALLAAAARRAADAIDEDADPTGAIEAAIHALATSVGGVMPSVFVLEHGRLWLVAHHGYAVVPDGISVESGVTGRAVRLARPQLVPDVEADPDYISTLPGVVSEIAVPLRSGSIVVGVLNIDSERALPDGAAQVLRPLARSLAPVAEALRARRTLDLAAMARLFVHLGSLRDPAEIGALAAASLPKVLPVEASQIVVWEDVGAPCELASWRAEDGSCELLTVAEIEAARWRSDPSAVGRVLDRGGARRAESIVWLPLRANAAEVGALVGLAPAVDHMSPRLFDTAAVLAAHVAASLDAAFALRRERHSAVTDPLTGILNRRGFEERLERELEAAQRRRLPLSILVIDCDDFKEINDRAGHEFGDNLLREIADALSHALPEGAEAARLGGDEFVVMLPGADADAAESLGGQIRKLLAEGLTDAGFPLRISAGISTYPFDGVGAPTLLRAADQALYAAKNSGKDRIASFREFAKGATGGARRDAGAAGTRQRRGRGGSPGAVLADAIEASTAMAAEKSADGVCGRLCKSLVFVVGATACSSSRVFGDYLVDASGHALRDVSLGDEAAYRIADFPLTGEVLRTGEPRAVSFADGDVDPAEAFILRELGMNALLMLPLHVAGRPWGLVELYEMRLRTFDADDIAVAKFLTSEAERRLEVVAAPSGPRPRPRVYELPSGRELRRGPRTR